METKTCIICHTEKPITEFRKRGKNSDKRRNECSECLNHKSKEYYAQNAEELKEWQKNHRIENNETLKTYHREKYLRNRDSKLKYAKEYKLANKELISQKAKAYRKANPDKVRSQELVQKYGIDLEQYNKMLAEQNNVCFICKQSETIKGQSLAVDHCHTTGKVRHLLCSRCNTSLGSLKEDTSIAEALVEYIKTKCTKS